MNGIPDLRYPDDVADAGALRTALRQTDLFESEDEAEHYVDDALERFRITMALLPEMTSGARVLELGSNPYFLTRLLRARGLDVTSANWFGPESGFGPRGRQVVNESGVSHAYEFDHFNIEADRFPYDDGAFDLVLFCEILEHLPADPSHALAEIHRVLKPGGVLVLTTPNAARLDNLLRMLRGDNVYEHLSGHGTYGRHNREYTVRELHDFLTACGYEVDTVFAADIGHVPDVAAGTDLGGVDLSDRGENLFAVAQAAGPTRWIYPAWLYASRHALRRVVRPDIVMGINCDLQTKGLHYVEQLGGRGARWTGPEEAELLLGPQFSGRGELVLEGHSTGVPGAPAVRLFASSGGRETSWEIAPDNQPFRLTAPVRVKAGEQAVRVWTDRTWSAKEVGAGEDVRRLGVMLCSAALERVGRR